MPHRRNIFRRLIGRFARRPYVSPTRTLPPIKGIGAKVVAVAIMNASR